MELQRHLSVPSNEASANQNGDHVVPNLSADSVEQLPVGASVVVSAAETAAPRRVGRRRSERASARALGALPQAAQVTVSERKPKRRESSVTQSTSVVAFRTAEDELLHNPEVVALVSEFARYGRPRWFTPERSTPRGMPLLPRGEIPIAELLELLTGSSASFGRVLSDRDRWSSALTDFCPPGVLELLKSRTDTMYANPIERGIALVQTNRETRAFLQYLISMLVTPYTDHPFATVSKWLELVCDYLALNADELLLMTIYLARYIALNAKYPPRPHSGTDVKSLIESPSEPPPEAMSSAREQPMSFGLGPGDFQRPLFRPIDPFTGKLMRACNEPRAQQWEQVLAVAAYTAVFSLEEFPRRTELEIRDLLGGVRWSMKAAQLLVYDALEWRLLVFEPEYIAVRDLVLQAAINGEQSTSQLLTDIITVVRTERIRADRERQVFMRSVGVIMDTWSESSVTSPSMLQTELTLPDESEKLSELRRALLANMETPSDEPARGDIQIEPISLSPAMEE